MANRTCKCGDAEGHAKAVSSAIFQCLMNISVQPDREDHWRGHADLLERKFTTEHGKHYSLFIDRSIDDTTSSTDGVDVIVLGA